MNLYRGEGNLPNLLLPTAKGTIPFPLKFAYQTVGEVVAAGARTGYSVGDKVFATHPHQDLFNIQAGGLVSRIPEGGDLAKAQFTSMFSVALQTVLQRPIRPGEIVAVSGLGLVGCFASFLARLSAGRLIAIDPSAARRRKATWIGADAIIPPEGAATAIAELSEGRGVDFFIETSGAPAALQTAILNTGVLGTIAVASWYGTRPVTLSLSPEFHVRSQKIVSIHVANLDEDARWPVARKFHTCLDFLNRIDVRALVSHRIPFKDAAEGYRLIDQGPDETFGVLLEHTGSR
jgi:threonine dehydrogenase-like Zn-dependent dehydrogenase